MTPHQLIRFEGALMKTQMVKLFIKNKKNKALEDAMYEIAKSTGKKCVILCDRYYSNLFKSGVLDCSAYISIF
jgi:hypothetical protein